MMCLFMHTTCSYTVRNKYMKNGCVRVDTKYDHFFNIFTQVIRIFIKPFGKLNLIYIYKI